MKSAAGCSMKPTVCPKWGHDFRPDYLYAARFIREFAREQNQPVPPVCCFTATAKKSVIEEIGNHFREELDQDLCLYAGGVERENLSFEVIPVSGAEKLEKTHAIISEQLSATEDPGGVIVYAATRKATEEIRDFLHHQGMLAEAFHAGVDAKAKREIIETFVDGHIPVICATNAFGMGIDKEDIRLVLHYDIPGSLENYIQEAEREIEGLNLNLQAKYRWLHILGYIINKEKYRRISADDIAEWFYKKMEILLETERATGLTAAQIVITDLHDMADAGLIDQGIMLSAIFRPQGKNNASKVFQTACDLENKLISLLQAEDPDADDGNWVDLNIRRLNQKLINEGYNSSPDVLRQLVKGISYDGKGLAASLGSFEISYVDRNRYQVRLQRSWDNIKKTIFLRQNVAHVILRTLTEMAKNQAAETVGEIGGDVQLSFTSDTLSAAMRLAGISIREMAESNSRDNIDFEGIIKNALELLKSEKGIAGIEPDEVRDRLLVGYSHILVDEYQDIDEDQYALVSAIAGKSLQEGGGRLTILAVGGDDQNIYTFFPSQPVRQRRICDNAMQ